MLPTTLTIQPVLSSTFNAVFLKPVLFLILICNFFTGDLYAQPSSESLDTLVSKYASLNWSGVLYAGNNKEPLYKKSFGFADREQQKAMQLTTPFKTESVGKMFTAVRILQLMQEGKLTLSTTVAAVLPDWQIPHADKIEVQHLLTHRSGLSSPWEHPDFQFGKIYSKEALKKIIETAPVAFETPGEKRYYSNSAFILLEEMIVTIDKQSFESSIRQHIFKPAGMQQTRFLNDSVLPAPAAVPYYQVSSNRFVKDETRYGDGKASGAGGWMSTAEDLYRFAKAYLNEQLLTAEWMKIQVSNNYTLAADAPDNRFGFQVLRGASKNSFVIGHNGGGKGFSIDVFFDVNTKNIVVFCSNLYGAGYTLTQKVFNLLYQQQYPEPSAPARIKLADWILEHPDTDNISTAVLQKLNIGEATDFLFFSVFDNLMLAKEYKAAGIAIRACRERYPSNINCWVQSGEHALALKDTQLAKEFFSKAYALAEEQKNETYKKMLQGRF